MAQLMPQFDITTFPSQILWIVVVFVLQYFVVAKFIIPRFKQLFYNRKSYIDERLKQAEAFSKKAEGLRIDYENKLEEIKRKYEKSIKQATIEIELDAETKLAELEKKFSEEMKNHEIDFKKLHSNMEAALNEVTVDLAANILNKLTQSKVSKEKLEKYIN